MPRAYPYVGPDELRRASEGKPGGDVVDSPRSISEWAARTGQEPNHEGLVRCTYVVDETGRLRIADYGSEHVACALGARVLAAGVAWFAIAPRSVSVERIDNQSTGYCPEPDCWVAVQAVLDLAKIDHPGRFTTELTFRRCTACRQRNVVRDAWYRCAVCDAELPRTWNFS